MSEMLPQERITLTGNPTSPDGGKKFNPKDRMGGIDVGGPMGRMFENVPKETPEQRKAASEASRAEAERLVDEWRAKIGDRPNTEQPLIQRDWRKGGVMQMPAITAEQQTELQKAMAKTEPAPVAEKPGFFKRLFG